MIGNFRLTVSLCVKGRRHTQSRAKKRSDLLPERTCKAGITIRNEGLTQSLSSLDVIHIQLGKALGCNGFCTGHEDRHLREPVHENTDGVITPRSYRQLS